MFFLPSNKTKHQGGDRRPRMADRYETTGRAVSLFTTAAAATEDGKH